MTTMIIDDRQAAQKLNNSINNHVKAMLENEADFLKHAVKARAYIRKCLNNLPAEEKKTNQNRAKIEVQEQNLVMVDSWLNDAFLMYQMSGYQGIDRKPLEAIVDDGVLWQPILDHAFNFWQLHRLTNGVQDGSYRIQGLRNYLFKDYANSLPRWEGWGLEFDGEVIIINASQMRDLLKKLDLLQYAPFDSSCAYRAGVDDVTGRPWYRYNGYTGIAKGLKVIDINGKEHALEKVRVSCSNQTFRMLAQIDEPTYTRTRKLVNSVFLTEEEQKDPKAFYLVQNKFELDFIRDLENYYTTYKGGTRRNTTAEEKAEYWKAGGNFSMYSIEEKDLTNGKLCAQKRERAIKQMQADKALRLANEAQNQTIASATAPKAAPATVVVQEPASTERRMTKEQAEALQAQMLAEAEAEVNGSDAAPAAPKVNPYTMAVPGPNHSF